MFLDEFNARDRAADVIAPKRSRLKVRRPGLAPSVRSGLELPNAIYGWQELGRKWFDKGCIGILAELPTHFWEDRRRFIPGAIRVFSQLTQTSLFPAFQPSKSKSEMVPLTLVPYFPITRGELGLCRIEGWVSLDATPDQVGSAIVSLVKSEQRRRNRIRVPQRPMKLENLKRDVIVYVLVREGWDTRSIEAQLKHMGCIPLPNKQFQKTLIRRILSRFEAIEEQIADESVNYQTTLPRQTRR